MMREKESEKRQSQNPSLLPPSSPPPLQSHHDICPIHFIQIIPPHPIPWPTPTPPPTQPFHLSPRHNPPPDPQPIRPPRIQQIRQRLTMLHALHSRPPRELCLERSHLLPLLFLFPISLPVPVPVVSIPIWRAWWPVGRGRGVLREHTPPPAVVAHQVGVVLCQDEFGGASG